MASPFPGMDPYLEQAVFWSSFHSRLIVALADALSPRLRPQYYVEVETRSYIETAETGELLIGIPDAVVLAAKQSAQSAGSEARTTGIVAVQPVPQQVILPMPAVVRERFLEVREIGSDVIVTVVEVLSPKNKRPGSGRTLYENKRQLILGSRTHLVEIDLLRGNDPLPMQGEIQPSHYRILVSRAEVRPRADLYAFSVRDPLPSFPLPLQTPDEAIAVELSTVMQGVYERASYDLRIDYSQPPPPPAFGNNDTKWIQERCRTP